MSSPRLLIIFALSILLLLIFAVPSLARSHVALHADFDQDVVDQSPSPSPPGAPADDSLVMYPFFGQILVRESVGTLTNRPLELVANADVSPPIFRGRLDPALVGCSNYVVSFRAMRRETTAYSVVHLKRGASTYLSRTEFRVGGGMSYNGVGNPISVSYVPDAAQLFEITVDISAGTTSLSVDGTAVPEAQDVPFLYASTGLNEIEFQFGAMPAASFVVDDLHVEASGCSTPVEATSWGTVKDRFR